MALKYAPVLKALGRELAKNRKVLFAYVYGSVLKRRDARDVDLAVYLKSPSDSWKEAQRLAVRLEKSLSYKYKLDVHSLNGAVPSFAFEVISSGRLLWERSKEDRRTWEAHTLSLYQDIKPMLDFHDRRFLGTAA